VQFIDVQLPTLWENLALDEALLDEAEAAEEPLESFRIWEWPQPAVVIGRSSRVAEEVNLDYCHAHAIPVVRRSSGGCAVVIGAGCLLYSVVLSYELHAALQNIDEAHRFVLQRLQQALQACGVSTNMAGTSDLIWQNRKFSGNSLRCKRKHLLYHGTLLYHFDLPLLEKCLATPPREPEYRQRRTHSKFVTNLSVSPATLRPHLLAAFDVQTTSVMVPQERLTQLLADKYHRESWHRER
jgi:lipoate---protein ligase